MKKEKLGHHLVVRVTQKQFTALLNTIADSDTNISELIRKIITDYTKNNKNIITK